MKLIQEDINDLTKLLEAASNEGISWDDAYELVHRLTEVRAKVALHLSLTKVRDFKKK
jgi:hypothetical protein